MRKIKCFLQTFLDGERIIGDVMNTHIRWIINWTCIKGVHFQPTDILSWLWQCILILK